MSRDLAAAARGPRGIEDHVPAAVARDSDIEFLGLAADPPAAKCIVHRFALGEEELQSELDELDGEATALQPAKDGTAKIARLPDRALREDRSAGDKQLEGALDVYERAFREVEKDDV